MIKRWLHNARSFAVPQNLMPSILTVVMALGVSGFNIWLGLLAVLGVCLVHLGGNLLDDYFDWQDELLDYREELRKEGEKAFTDKYPYLRDGSTTLGQLRAAIAVFFGLALLCGLIIWIALELHRRRKTAVVPFFICVISVTPMVTVSSLQYMHVYILGLLAMLTVLKAGKWIDRKKLWPEFFAFIGILTSYIDLLTFPLVAFALPLMACFISDNEKLSLRFFFIMAISWAAGYGVFWAMKWVISWLTGYGEELGSALDSVARRSSRPEQGAANRLQAIVLNLRVFQRPGYIAAFLVGFLVRIYNKKIRFLDSFLR